MLPTHQNLNKLFLHPASVPIQHLVAVMSFMPPITLIVDTQPAIISNPTAAVVIKMIVKPEAPTLHATTATLLATKIFHLLPSNQTMMMVDNQSLSACYVTTLLRLSQSPLDLTIALGILIQTIIKTRQQIMATMNTIARLLFQDTHQATN